ncbi:hypothetical protein AAFA46_08445 [Oscillospiraceae bacterium WX1]
MSDPENVNEVIQFPGRKSSEEYPGLEQRVISAELFEQLRTMDRWSLSTHLLKIFKYGYEKGWRNAIKYQHDQQGNKNSGG